MAIQYHKKLAKLGQVKKFRSAATGNVYGGKVVRLVEGIDNEGLGPSVIVEVSGRGFYSGSCAFTAEDDDELRGGFLLK